MSKLSDNVIKSMQKNILEEKLINIDELHANNDFFNSDYDFMQKLNTEFDETYSLLNETLMPFVTLTLLLGMVSEMLLHDDKLEEAQKIIRESEDRFLPGSLLTPITQINFECWKLFDLEIDQEGSSLASFSMEVMKSISSLDDMTIKSMIEGANSSFMNFYTYEGSKEGYFLFKDIFTHEEKWVLSSDEIDVDIGSILFTRLIYFPANEGIWLNIGNPHVILYTTAKDIIDALKKYNINENDFQISQNISKLMKKLSSDCILLQYISESYLETTDGGVIQLTGLPFEIKKEVPTT